MPLDDNTVQQAVPREKLFKLFDEAGLYLVVTPAGGKYWRLKYRVAKKEQCFSLGVYPEVSLEDARKARDEARALLRGGIDPAARRRQQRGRRMGYHKRATVHGWRATASTILNETGFKPDLIERQLAHAERNKVRAAYHRSQYLDERRQMMQAWADLLDTIAAGSEIIPLRGRAA